jgi:hypothetical protein
LLKLGIEILPINQLPLAVKAEGGHEVSESDLRGFAADDWYAPLPSEQDDPDCASQFGAEKTTESKASGFFRTTVTPASEVKAAIEGCQLSYRSRPPISAQTTRRL